MFEISLSTANTIYKFANIALIIGAVIVAVGTVAVYLASGVRDRYADERREMNETQTAAAKADATRANESTAKLEESNVKLQAAAEHERAERLKLEARIAPRRLSPASATAMRASALQLCQIMRKITVTAANGNIEAQTYATDIVSILKEAGCSSDLALPIPGLRPEVVGVGIGVRDIANIPPEAFLLENVLIASGIACSINPMMPEFFTGESIVLVIGAKPLQSN